jgi:uncharacterized circularly permuted ATP-grasp superfamily protein
MKQEAVNYYHDLLNDSVAADNYTRLNDLLKERKLFFGDRALCTVLRPHFYTSDQFAYLKNETEIILRAFGKAHQACLADPHLRRQFHLESWEEEMIQLDRGNNIPWNTSRLDSFFSHDHGTLQFIEYNAETPAGMAYEDVLAETFLDLPLMKTFQEKYSARPLRVRGHLLDALLETYKQWLGRSPEQQPQIAIVDWDDVPTRNEHRLCKEWFESHGVKTILTDPRNLEYRKGKLYDRDFRVDLIYKRVLGQELFQRMGMDNPIFRALRDRAVCISNSFGALLLYKKSSLAFLSDEVNHHLFDAEEIRAIGEHIPWTRILSDRNVEWVAENRQKLVLKPNDAYGGKGVVLGWETSPDDWKSAISAALNLPTIVQEKVNVASEIYPSYVDGKLHQNRLFVDADPFIFMGATVHGVLTRLSSAALLNVTAGHGSTIPSFIIEKK